MLTPEEVNRRELLELLVSYYWFDIIKQSKLEEFQESRIEINQEELLLALALILEILEGIEG